MKKSLSLLIALFAGIVTLVVGMSSASAAVTVKTLPTAKFSGPSATVTGGNFSGLGNIPAFAVVTVSGIATYTCHNPGNGNGGNVVPGQNPVPAQGSSSAPAPLGNSDHNGRGTIPPTTASVSAPATPTASEVGCGGGGATQWTVVLDQLIATGAHLEVRQPQGGALVFCRNFTLGGPATGTAC
jgi:hypothetical protein